MEASKENGDQGNPFKPLPFPTIRMEAAVKGGPWTFDNHLLVLGRMQVGVPLQNIPLYHVEFWVQVFNLPVGFMTELVGKLLGNLIGEFVEHDSTNNSSIWHNCMSIQVKIDVRWPLKNERKVRVVGGEWCMVQFRYEKHGTFCFFCDCLGHTEQKCEDLFVVAVYDGVRGWSVVLRASGTKAVDWRRWQNRWLREEGRNSNLHDFSDLPNQNPGSHATNNGGERETTNSGNATIAINRDKGKSVMLPGVEINPVSLGICEQRFQVQVNANLRPIKVDEHTLQVERGRFAGFCGEIDLNQPVVRNHRRLRVGAVMETICHSMILGILQLALGVMYEIQIWELI